MAVSPAQKMAKEKYRNEKRDQMTIEVPKGKRDAYKLIAAELGISLSMLIQISVEDYGANHAGKEFLPSTPTDKLSAEDKRLIENLALLPKPTRAKFIGLVEDFANQPKGGD